MSELERMLFLSHASVDREVVLELARDLKDRGWPCWVAGIDTIDGGEEWRVRIIQEMRRSTAVVLALTHASNDSDEVRREINYAVDLLKLKVIPAVFDDIGENYNFGYSLAGLQGSQITAENREEVLDSIVRGAVEAERLKEQSGGEADTVLDVRPPPHRFLFAEPSAVLDLDLGVVVLSGSAHDLVTSNPAKEGVETRLRLPFITEHVVVSADATTGVATGAGQAAVFDLDDAGRPMQSSLILVAIPSDFVPSDVRQAGDFVRCVGVADGQLTEACLAVRWHPRSEMRALATAGSDAAFFGADVVTVALDGRVELDGLPLVPGLGEFNEGWEHLDVVKVGRFITVAGHRRHDDDHHLIVAVSDGLAWEVRVAPLQGSPERVLLSRHPGSERPPSMVGVSKSGQIQTWDRAALTPFR